MMTTIAPARHLSVNVCTRVAEVMVDGNQPHLVRTRETVAGLFALEKLLPED